MNRCIKIITVLAVCLIFATCSMTVFADNTGKVLYKNDFSKGVDGTMDYLSAGTTSVETIFGETFMRCTPTTSGTRAFRINFGPEETENVDISFRIRSAVEATNSDAFFGVYFRSPSIPANAMFGYQLRFSSSKASLVIADRFGASATTTLREEATAKVKSGLWYNVKICMRGTRIVIYVNGNKVFDYTDDYYPSDGSFGICGVRYIFDIDDISIIGYGGKLPEPIPNEAPLWTGEPNSDYKVDVEDSGKERLNLAIVGGEQGSTTKVVVNPNELTVNSWIAVGLIAALVLMAISTLIVSIKLINLIKQNKSETPIALADNNAEGDDA